MFLLLHAGVMTGSGVKGLTAMQYFFALIVYAE